VRPIQVKVSTATYGGGTLYFPKVGRCGEASARKPWREIQPHDGVHDIRGFALFLQRVASVKDRTGNG
jgi:hypothetical protein